MGDINKHILTLSVVVGEGCNANCEFCISKLTFKTEGRCRLWWQKLEKACEVAKRGAADTVIITSKGEPTMADDLPQVIEACSKYFPIVELQTNGMQLGFKGFIDELALKGLTTAAISCVSYKQEDNQKIISKNCPQLSKIVDNCRNNGLMTRASLIMTDSICGTPELLKEQIDGLRNIGFHQITLRIMGAPDISLIQHTEKAKEVVDWIEKNTLSEINLNSVRRWLQAKPLLRKFPWGSEVRNVDGISVCLTEHLSDEHGSDLRYVIYFPDGHLRTRWDVSGSMLF